MVGMDIPWAIFISLSMVVSVSFPVSVVMWMFIMVYRLVVDGLMVNIVMSWLEVVVAVSVNVVNDWSVRVNDWSVRLFGLKETLKWSMVAIWGIPMVSPPMCAMSCPAVATLIVLPFVFSLVVPIFVSVVWLEVAFVIVVGSPWFVSMVPSFPSVVAWEVIMVVFRIPVAVTWVSIVVVCVSVVEANIIVFVTWKMFLVTGIVVIGWFSSHWGDVGQVMEVSVHIVVVVWLHLENEVALLNVCLGGAESCAVGIKSSIVTLVPSLCVEGVEVIFPVEVKASCFFVVFVSFNIVVEEVPWHVLRVKALAP